MHTVAFDLGAAGYVADEHVVTGEANSYAAVGVLDPDGRWSVAVDSSAPFTTRVVVYRPTDPARANGTVVVEWLNVTGGLDIPAVWMATHRHLRRDGYTWVGITAQQVGVEGGGLMPGLGLRQTNAERYAALRHPGDAFAYDLFAQVASAVRDELVARHGLRVDRLIATGASQSAIHLTTFVNAIDAITPVFDGFLLQGRAGAAAPLDGWTFHRDLDVDARRSRLRGSDRIREDARVPVFVVQSETDVFGTLAYLNARQPDSVRFRLWEVAGAAHADTYFLCASPHDSGALPVADLAALIARSESSGIPTEFPINRGPQVHYVMQRAVDALGHWITDGTPPPSAPRLAVDDRDCLGVDEWGVARGGVRTPWVDAPAEVLSGLGQPGIMTDLFGTTRALPGAARASRYPGGGDDYRAQFRAATTAAVDAGFVLAADAPEIVALGDLAW